MKREAEKDQAAHARDSACGLRLRGHAAAEGLATRYERNAWYQPRRRAARSTYGGMGERGRVGGLG